MVFTRTELIGITAAGTTSAATRPGMLLCASIMPDFRDRHLGSDYWTGEQSSKLNPNPPSSRLASRP